MQGYSNPVECSDQGFDKQSWDTCADDEDTDVLGSGEEGDEDSGNIIQVTNYGDISDEILMMYFESKRSGGGEILSLDEDQEKEETIVIQFRHSKGKIG